MTTEIFLPADAQIDVHNLEIHPILEQADFWVMPDAEFAEFCEKMRVTGYKQHKRIMLFEGKILDGRHRYRAAKELGILDQLTWDYFDGTTEEAVEHVIGENTLREREGTRFQKIIGVARMVKIQKRGRPLNGTEVPFSENGTSVPFISLAQASRSSGFGRQYIREVCDMLAFDAKYGTDIIAMGNAGKTATQAAAQREIDRLKSMRLKEAIAKRDAARAKRAARAAARQAAIDRAKELAARGELYELIHTPIADLHHHVEAGSADAIITDPPYPAEFLPVWDDLREFAIHALKPGGVLVALGNHMNFPANWASLTADPENLAYRWLGAEVLPQGRQAFDCPKVTRGWKPILLFTRKGAPPLKYAKDRYDAPRAGVESDKDFHVWGQNLQVFREMVEEFVPAGGLVIDPFLGGGTTAVAAVSNNFRFIGADIDEACIAKTKVRLNDGDV